MKIRFFIRSFIPVAAGLLSVQLCAVSSLRADLVNGQAALSVLGKPDFTNSTANGPAANELNQPEGIAIDPVTKKFFVSDRGSNRVLRFTTTAAYRTGAAAEAVFGQADFISGLANRGGATAANTLNAPRSIHVDASGRLWVADDSNNRVLRFDGASSKGSGSNADAVLGQLNFTSSGTATTQSGMTSPTGVITDPAGNLYVADYGNNRVLIFYNVAAKGNGANADRVLGQAGFLTNTFGTTAGTLNRPWGVSVNAQGQLWVGDYLNNRVLRYDNAATIANGSVASVVLGQVNFTTSAIQPLSAASLDSAYYLASAPDGTLWVGDYNNNRVLGFRNSAGITNGAGASIVLGQPDFISNGAAGPDAVSISGANALAVDSEGGLFVSDYVYDRVMRFSGVVKISAPSRYTAIRGKSVLRGTSEHASLIRYKVPGEPVAVARGKVSPWKVKVKGLTRPVTRVRVEAVALDNRKALKIIKVRNS